MVFRAYVSKTSKRVNEIYVEGVNEMDPHYPVVSKDDEEEVTENKFSKET